MWVRYCSQALERHLSPAKSTWAALCHHLVPVFYKCNLLLATFPTILILHPVLHPIAQRHNESPVHHQQTEAAMVDTSVVSTTNNQDWLNVSQHGHLHLCAMMEVGTGEFGDTLPLCGEKPEALGPNGVSEENKRGRGKSS